MTVPTDITAGTITLTNGSASFTGNGTGWAASDIREGDLIVWIEGGEDFAPPVILSIESNTAGTLIAPWEGPNLTDAPYRIRYQWDSSRVSAQSRQLIDQLGNGNIQSFSALEGPGVPVFDGPHSLTIKPETDFINGVAYNVQVDTLVDRAAYDGQSAGFAVLVSDVGDGRAAIYSKLSNASGDWSDPAYVTGPSTDVTVGTVTELDYGDAPTITGTSGPGTLELNFGLPGGPALSVGSVTRGDADVTSTPVTGGYELDFTIPSQVAQGDYSGATAYVTGDIVQDQGSSWVALQATTGNAPPTLPTTSNAYWQLLARAGSDGAGTVTSLSGGTGISVDSTDPTVPVVSAVIASQAEAEGGTVANKLMTPERTAQAIAELSPEVPADLYRPNNILGTVSQSGGVPTGAVIERGSNANGEYVRFADGTQMCWAELTLSYNSAAFCSEIWTYPAAFSMVPKPNGAVTDMSNATPNYASITAVAEAPGTGTVTSTELRVTRIQGSTNFGSGDTVGISAFVIGRWF